jgi:crotonobetainyl-CoA:carnitine CoA-transferase CaiB-like acyl-CoA transferase
MLLRGVRVLDLTRLLPGPYATRLLAELGAEIIKVEDPNGGDYARWAPPVAGDPPTGGLFTEVNRGKKSVALDLKTEHGRLALRALVARADVLVDSFRPGVLARVGLDPTALMAEHSRLIYCAMTGFGLTGPDVHRAGHDIGYLGRSGGLALSGPIEEPVVPGFQTADIGASLVAVSGILAALYAREKTGRGAVVDVSLTESALAFSAASFGMMHGGSLPRRGQEILDGSRPCYAVYATKSGYLAVGSLEPKFWAAFVGALGLPELESCALDTGEAGRAAKAAISARLMEKTRDEWAVIFRGVEACVEPVLELDEVEADPQHRARHVFDAEKMVRSPIRVSDWEGVGAPMTASEQLSRAPQLGEHTEEVLAETGISEEILKMFAPKRST